MTTRPPFFAERGIQSSYGKKITKILHSSLLYFIVLIFSQLYLDLKVTYSIRNLKQVNSTWQLPRPKGMPIAQS